MGSSDFLRRYAAVVALSCVMFSQSAAAQFLRSDVVALGTVDRVQGQATLSRGSETMSAIAGLPVVRGDSLSTAADSRLLLVFKDGTRLTLGERAEAFIDYFVYNPIKRSGAAFVDIIKGAFRFTAGRMRELEDKRVRVRAGTATLAVDGSDVWGGPIDDVYGILLIKGRIEVRNDAGMVVLRKKRVGSTIAGPLSAPEMPVKWDKDKLGKAFAAVSFR